MQYRTEHWRLATWDCDAGLTFPASDSPAPVPQDTTDPLAVIRAASQLSQGSTTTLLVLRNFHRFLAGTEILQAIERQVSQGKRTRTFVVIVAPIVNLPPEIEKQFIVIEHELPGREQLREIATGAAQGDELPAEEDLARVLDSAAGLTRYEAEGAFSLFIVRHGRLVPSTPSGPVPRSSRAVGSRLTPSPNPEPVLVRESLCPGWGWKGFSDEEATQCRADRWPASTG